MFPAGGGSLRWGATFPGGLNHPGGRGTLDREHDHADDGPVDPPPPFGAIVNRFWLSRVTVNAVPTP